MLKVLFVAIGGAVGSVLRYLIGGWVQQLSPGFPVGTLTINIVGCFFIGFLATLFTGPFLIRDEYRAFILVGVLGGFTTFSTFSWDTNRLADTGQFTAAAANVLLSVGVGLVATWIGARLAQALYGV